MEQSKRILTGFLVSIFIAIATPTTSVALTEEERDQAKADRDAAREERKNRRQNASPTISGTPPSSVELNSAYAFMPTADDPDGNFLTFSIVGQPAWAYFDPVTGELFGTPVDATHVGTTGEITITVTDGVAFASLPPFSITVTAPAEPPADPPADPEPPADSLISSTLPENYVWDTLATGKEIYIDRGYTFTSIPVWHQGWRYLKTANDDKYVSDPVAVELGVTEPVRVIVAYDRRISALPSWLQHWTSTGLTTETTDTLFNIFYKDFPAGSVTLGGNEMGYSNYSVAIAALADIDDSGDPPPAPDDPADPNTPPTISGTPLRSVDQDVPYSFVPTAADADGDALVFSIVNKPSWAAFDASTGRVSGTPTLENVGITRDIVISVSDGSTSSSLAAFDIEVVAVGATGSALLSWDAPTTNEDGTVLTDLAGFRILYGPKLGQWDHSIVLRNPGLTSHMIEGLTAGPWHFTVTAFDYAGNESGEAIAVSKLVE